MAKITLFPVLESLSGRFGKLVFYSRYGKTYTRRHVVPANPNTEAQRAVRRTFGDAVRAWQSLPGEEKDRWRNRAVRLRRSGYNLFLSRYLRQDVPAGHGSKGFPGRDSKAFPLALEAFPSVHDSLLPHDWPGSSLFCARAGAGAG